MNLQEYHSFAYKASYPKCTVKYGRQNFSRKTRQTWYNSHGGFRWRWEDNYSKHA